MRFFALQTDLGELKKQFMLQDEKEILVTNRHGIVFFVSLLKATAVTVAVWAVLVTAFIFAGTATLRLLIGVLAVVAAVYELYAILNAYIDWRYNILIITTEKIVIINQSYLFYQNVKPIHLNNVRSATCESQFFGIWRCGVLHINLQEMIDNTTKEIVLPYIPQPDFVVSAIEQAISLEKKKASEEPEEQLPKIEEMQQKVEEKMPDAGVPPPETPAQSA
ncbi:hypothetical protein HZA87_05795 [Candidatus Uhrbacteria bacterium]|nr:hypothetical protein [Candidatus Uhrbacteria bacterium]